jgi:hypothetical protein
MEGSSIPINQRSWVLVKSVELQISFIKDFVTFIMHLNDLQFGYLFHLGAKYEGGGNFMFSHH